METFYTPKRPGTYKLECWGAGVDGLAAAHGGYSVGEILSKSQEILYVCVGGKGSQYSGSSGGKGGYNGGGNGGNGYSPYRGGTGGGGATHIATQTGLLKELKDDYKTKLLLVAGGSGGIALWGNCVVDVNRVFGGGTEAGASYNLVTGAIGTKATQTQGNAFGQGQQGITKIKMDGSGAEGNGGGGGGLWGGYSPQVRGASTNCLGGGGSGYVNSTLLSNAQTIAGNLNFPSPDGGTETGHTGDGACIITQLSFN